MKKFKYFTHLLLLITVFTFTNCQKEDVNFNDSQNTTKKKIHVETLSKDDYSTNLGLQEKLQLLDDKKNSLNQFQREEYNATHGFTLDTETATYIEDGDSHSYTFSMYSDNPENDILENFVLVSREDGSYQPNIYRYELQDDDITDEERISNENIITYTKLILPDDLNFVSSLFARENGDCIIHYYKSSTYKDPLTQDDCESLPEYAEPCVHSHTVINLNCDSNNPEISDTDEGGSEGYVYVYDWHHDDYEEWDPISNEGSGSGAVSSDPNGTVGTAETTPLANPEFVLIKNLRLNYLFAEDLSLISWIENSDNIKVVLEVSVLLEENRDENGVIPQNVKDDIEAALKVISGLEDLNSLTTISTNKFLMKIIGGSLDSLSPSIFGEQKEAWSNIDQDNNLGLGDWVIVAAKGFAIYTDFKSNGLNFDRNKAEIDSAFIALLSNVKSMVGEHWPQTADQWKAIGSIMGQFLVEIGIAFIPGSDILDVVAGLDEGDYVAVTLGFAGLLVDAFGGTILKAIGKVGKFAYKTFKIFKIVFRYLDEVVDAITFGHKVELYEGTVRILGELNSIIATVENNVLKFVKNSAKSLVKVADLKFLDNIAPTGNGFISAGKINNKALRIDPQNSDYKSIVDDIKLNGDPQGNLSEGIMDDLLEQDGFKKPIQSNEYPNLDTVQLNGGQGFDNVLIKRDNSGNITEIIINESKQVSALGAIDLSSGISGTSGSLCSNCTQMSVEWIDDVLKRMQNQGGDLGSLADEISDYIDSGNNITQLVSGVNKNTGELIILNITGFSTP